MKADTTFRFVSVRPPETQFHPPPTRMTAPPDAVESIKKHMAGASSSGLSPKEQADAVAAKIENSPEFYTHNSDWVTMLQHASAVRNLITTQIESGAAEDFRSNLSALFKTIFGESLPLDEIETSSRFDAMERSIWLSFYACVLRSKSSRGLYRDVVHWLRILSVVKATADSSLLQQRLANFYRLRPTLPLSLMRAINQQYRDHARKADRATKMQSPYRQAKAAAVDTLRTQLKTLSETRDALEAILRKKLAAAERHDAKRSSDKSSSKAPSKASGEAEGRLSPAHMPAPWYLVEDDFRGREDLRRSLQHFELDTVGIPLPRQISQLERLIASHRSQMTELQSKTVIVPFGGTLALVKRPMRTGEQGND